MADMTAAELAEWGEWLVNRVAEYNGLLEDLHVWILRFKSRKEFIESHEAWITENPDDPKLPLVQGMVAQAEKQQVGETTRVEELMIQVGDKLWGLMNSREAHVFYQSGEMRVPCGLKLNGEDVDLYTMVRKAPPEPDGGQARGA